MSLKELVLQFRFADLASAGLRAFKGEVKDVDSVVKKAGAGFEQMGRSWQSAMASLDTARQLKTQLVDPGLKAASQLQTALRGLESDFNFGSLAESQKVLAQFQRESGRIAGPTAFSQGQIMEGFRTAKGLGITDVGQNIATTESAAQLATVTDGLALPEAIAAMKTLTTVFQAQGQESQAADMLSRANVATGLGVPQLTETFSTAPMLGQFMDFQEGVTLAGVLKQGGTQGSEAGTALDAFFSKAASDKKLRSKFFDDSGQFVGTGAARGQLQQMTAGMNAPQVQAKLEKVFGDVGKRAALAILSQDSGQITAGIQGARGMDERAKMLQDTAAGQVDAAGGTWSTVLAQAFQPMLAPVQSMAASANDALGQIGEAMSNDPRLATAASAAAAAPVAAAAGAALLQVMRSGGAGLGALRSLAGAGLGAPLAGGVAAGKALEATMGVTPVFVTNWPAGGALSGLASVAGGAGGAKMGVAGKALGALALAPVAAAAGGAVGSAYGWGIKKVGKAVEGTDLAPIFAKGLAAAVRFTALRAFMSDKALNAAEQVSSMDNAKLKQVFRINVNVDQAGGATVSTSEGADVEVAARRAGAM